GRLRYEAPAVRQTLCENKVSLIALLSTTETVQEANPDSLFPQTLGFGETGNLKTEEGVALLQPFLPVIQAAHQGELPAVIVRMGGVDYELNDYICRLAAPIW